MLIPREPCPCVQEASVRARAVAASLKAEREEVSKIRDTTLSGWVYIDLSKLFMLRCQKRSLAQILYIA